LNLRRALAPWRSPRCEIVDSRTRCLALCLLVLNCNAPQQSAAESTGTLRQYFIFAEEVEWNYAPHNMDHMTGKPFDKATVTWVEKGKDRVGQVYRKAIYLEYTDATFQTLKPSATIRQFRSIWAHHAHWYLMTMGDGFNFHTPHWHGNVVMVDKHRTDILSLAPAQFVVSDMVPDNVGTMFHCHLSDHMSGGMMTDYEVLP